MYLVNDMEQITETENIRYSPEKTTKTENKVSFFYNQTVNKRLVLLAND